MRRQRRAEASSHLPVERHRHGLSAGLGGASLRLLHCWGVGACVGELRAVGPKRRSCASHGPPSCRSRWRPSCRSRWPSSCRSRRRRWSRWATAPREPRPRRGVGLRRNCCPSGPRQGHGRWPRESDTPCRPENRDRRARREAGSCPGLPREAQSPPVPQLPPRMHSVHAWTPTVPDAHREGSASGGGGLSRGRVSGEASQGWIVGIQGVRPRVIPARSPEVPAPHL